MKRYVRTNEPLWSVNANITSFIESGLAPNTQYGRLIVAWNNDFIGESPYASYDSSRNQYYFNPAGGSPDYPPPSFIVAAYTSIEPPAGVEFGPKGQTRLTVRLTSPLPSNLTASGNHFGYFNPNYSGFFIENIETGKNISDTSFPVYASYSPAQPTTDGWWKYNDDFDPLPQVIGNTRGQALWETYLKNGPVTYNSSNGTYTAEHKWPYWCIEGLQPNTPYTFKAKARNGDGDETAWCPSSSQVWTLPLRPRVKCDQSDGACYSPGTRFTFTNLDGFGIGTVDHYHILWTTNPSAIPDESSPKWFAGDWIVTENRLGTYYLVVMSHNAQHGNLSNMTGQPAIAQQVLLSKR